MSKLHIKFPMHLTVKLSENSVYHHKSSFKQENILKNAFAIIFVNLVPQILFPINFKKSSFIMRCLGSCPFQQILDIKSSVKVTLFTFNNVSFVRNTCPTVTFA